MRGLTKERADIVAGHLLMAGELIDENPTLAYEHALAAKRRASRLPMAREGVAETAYAAEKYDVALGEYRALRRMTGSSDYLPVMADCERALGRPQQALRLIREAAGQPMDPAAAIELRIIEAGARHDLGQQAEAARLLRAAVAAHSGRRDPMLHPALARLHYALADVLLDLQEFGQAREEFARSADLDDDGSTDAGERLDALDGMAIEFDQSENDQSEDDRAADDEGTSERAD